MQCLLFACLCTQLSNNFAVVYAVKTLGINTLLKITSGSVFRTSDFLVFVNVRFLYFPVTTDEFMHCLQFSYVCLCVRERMSCSVERFVFIFSLSIVINFCC